MATATQSDSEAAQKRARLKAQQELEVIRRRESDLAEKERQKHERWNKALESHEKQAKEASQVQKSGKPTTTGVVPPKPKILQPVQYSNTRKKTNVQQRSMTFKKLLKEAA